MVIVRKRKGNHSRGAVSVELALVLPLMLLVTFGAIRYGWFFLKTQQITNAARYGARVAIRADASTEDVIDAVGALLGPYGANIITDVNNPPVTFAVNDVNCPDLNFPIELGDAITVTIKVPAADVDILPLGLFDFEPDGWNLGASVTMAKEGF
jgi:hypothetical protein